MTEALGVTEHVGHQAGAATGAENRPQALVVDDSRTVCRILSRILTELGFVTTSAADGVEGLRALASLSLPRLALVDWNMPVMDGYTFVCEVRKRPEWNDVSLMMVTTENSADRVVLALEAGANEYVMKPFTREVIASKLEVLGIETPQMELLRLEAMQQMEES